MEQPRPDRTRTRARVAVALLISILLHLALGLWFARARPGPVEAASRELPPIEVQVVQIPAPESRAPAPPPPPRPQRRAPLPTPPEASTAEAATSSPPQGSAPPPGAPRRIDLSPPQAALPGTGPVGSGRTILNRPETSEEHAAAVAREAGHVKELVDGWIAGDVGVRRVQLGLVDPYFGSVRGALQEAIERGAPEGMPGRSVGEQLLDSVLGGMSTYGKTGNPYGEGQVPNAEPAEREFTGHPQEMARRYPGSRSINLGGGGGTGLSSEQLQACVDQGRMLDDFLSGKFGDGLTATVELSQAPDGKVLGVRLVAPSALPAFDRHVLSIAPAALAKLPPPPDKGFGIKPTGMKSVWRFEGRVKFKRPLKEWNPLTGGLTGTLVGALYGLACPGLGPPITYDAATGQLELIDLAHPKFTCTVKLVRVD